jgi:hypothetical protein
MNFMLFSQNSIVTLMLEFIFYSSVYSVNEYDSVAAYVTGCARHGGLMMTAQ